MIAPLVLEALPEIRALCKSQGVERMSLFGSATTEHFSEETSDVDFLVNFFDSEKAGYARRYLALAEGLERVLRRSVDLVTEKSINNPIFRDILEKTKILIYDDPS